MREAKLVGLSQDGKSLILAEAETGEEFAVPVDDRLRAALRGDRARLGQLEIQMESALRPRDIQARIRAGESPEAVAAVAQVPMERLMAFAGPVMAEREHIASLAQRASVRRRGGEGPTRNLGVWVAERLRTRQVDPQSADWDAWRREDGRWAVRVSYLTGEDEHVAMFAYDAPGRYAVPDDDEARWLVGEQPEAVVREANERRLAAVTDLDSSVAPDHGADSYEAGFEDAISITRERHVSRDSDRDAGPQTGSGPSRLPGQETGRGPRRVHSVPSPDEEPTVIDVPIDRPAALRPSVRAVERPAQVPGEDSAVTPLEERAAPGGRSTDRSPAAPADPHLSRPAEDRQGAQRPAEPRPAEPGSADGHPVADSEPEVPEDTQQTVAASGDGEADADGDSQGSVDEPKKKPVRRASKRASVPSWDEIMFGKKAD